MTATTTRPLPWDAMGSALKPSSRTNLTKALKDSGLDYEVTTQDLRAYLPGKGITRQKGLDVPKHQAIVRPEPGTGKDGDLMVCGVTGKRFTPIQNLDAFGIAQDLCGDFGAQIDGLADFRHGGASILALALPDQTVNLVRPDGGTDETRLFLNVVNYHNGNGALAFAITPVRTACTNVLPMALKEAQRVWKINHTPNAQKRVEVAREAIKTAVGFHNALQVHAQAMMDTPMVDAEFAKMVAGMWPVDPEATGAVAERKRETQASLVNLYRDSPTLDGIRGTIWSGYNAVTEWADWYRPVKGDDPDRARAEGAIDGPNVRFKSRIWETFSRAV